MAVFTAQDDIFDGMVSEGIGIVDFYSTHCGPCRVLLPKLLQIEAQMPFVPNIGGRIYTKILLNIQPLSRQRISDKCGFNIDWKYPTTNILIPISTKDGK